MKKKLRYGELLQTTYTSWKLLFWFVLVNLNPMKHTSSVSAKQQQQQNNNKEYNNIPFEAKCGSVKMAGHRPSFLLQV